MMTEVMSEGPVMDNYSKPNGHMHLYNILYEQLSAH